MKESCQHIAEETGNSQGKKFWTQYKWLFQTTQNMAIYAHVTVKARRSEGLKEGFWR